MTVRVCKTERLKFCLWVKDQFWRCLFRNQSLYLQNYYKNTKEKIQVGSLISIWLEYWKLQSAYLAVSLSASTSFFWKNVCTPHWSSLHVIFFQMSFPQFLEFQCIKSFESEIIFLKFGSTVKLNFQHTKKFCSSGLYGDQAGFLDAQRCDPAVLYPAVHKD